MTSEPRPWHFRWACPLKRDRGRIFNTAGDSVIAEFPSVVDVVQCAVAVQRAVGEENGKRSPEQQMHFRIGVHVGDVLVKGDNLFGDGVNIATRLEALAEPGGICVSGSVRDYVGKKLSATSAARIAERRRVAVIWEGPLSASPLHIWRCPRADGTVPANL
jgi:class 3 adenylate cyclase